MRLKNQREILLIRLLADEGPCLSPGVEVLVTPPSWGRGRGGVIKLFVVCL